MSIDLQSLTNYENELIRRVTYYTSLFIGSLTVIIITVLIDGSQTDFSVWIKIIFSAYMISVLNMVLISNLIWQKVSTNTLKYTNYQLGLEYLDMMLSRVKENSENNTDSADQQRNVKAINEGIEKLQNNSLNIPLAGKWYIVLFDWNIIVSTGLLAFGIICIVI
jgi:hypothetical protein